MRCMTMSDENDRHIVRTARMRHFTLLTSAAALLLGATACERTPEEPQPRGISSADQAHVSRLQKAPPPKPLPGKAGDWLESRRYRLRVLGIHPCGSTEETTQRDTYRLGVTVEVQATRGASVSDVLASPKAATLEKDGQVFRALMSPKPSEHCESPLELTRLRPGDAASGVLVFEAPSVDHLSSAIFAFRPPRWGGEVRLEVQLPDCFGDCPDENRDESGNEGEVETARMDR